MVQAVTKSGVLLLVPSFAWGMDREMIRTAAPLQEAYQRLAEEPLDSSYIVYKNGDMHSEYALTIKTNQFFTRLEDIANVSRCTACTLKEFTPESDPLEIAGLCGSMPNLTSLSFCGIPIATLNFPIKNPHKKLTQLEITNTDITEVACADIFTAFPALQRLHINGNQKMARILYPTYYHPALREFDVQNNALTHINLNKLLMISTKLESITISGNPLVHIEWQPDDFLAHEKVPILIMKNIKREFFSDDKKLQLLQSAADDNRVYLWMKKFVPALCALSSVYWFRAGLRDVKLTMLCGVVGIPLGYCVGRLVVDYILFQGQEEKRIPYFKPQYDE